MSSYFQGSFRGIKRVISCKICSFLIAVISPLATEKLSIRLPSDARFTCTTPETAGVKPNKLPVNFVFVCVDA